MLHTRDPTRAACRVGDGALPLHPLPVLDGGMAVESSAVPGVPYRGVGVVVLVLNTPFPIWGLRMWLARCPGDTDGMIIACSPAGSSDRRTGVGR